MNTKRLTGVLAPAITPFRRDLSVDVERYARHAKWLLTHGCSGLAAFGTNSEANSLSVEERMAALESLVERGVPAEKLMPGTGCCALSDSVRLTAHAVNLGCSCALMLPPFYYKGVPDDGLFRSFAEVIERVGDARLRVYLYHIPPVAQVSISVPLIERLVRRYPQTVVGIKDSSGDWNNTQAILDLFKGADFDVFVGSETLLLKNMRSGGVGCISAGANVNAPAVHRLFERWNTPEADQLQAAVSANRAVFQNYLPLIGSLKAVVAHYADDPDWVTVRPPLVELDADKTRTLMAELAALGFTMPDLAPVHA
jgi:4-hydroxy-tetrahydrodipicolinate synthase